MSIPSKVRKVRSILSNQVEVTAAKVIDLVAMNEYYTKPVVPIDTKPVDTKPVVPIDTKPVDTKPVVSIDTKPVDTKPVVSIDTKPVDTKPVVPIDTKPVVLIDTKPVDVKSVALVEYTCAIVTFIGNRSDVKCGMLFPRRGYKRTVSLDKAEKFSGDGNYLVEYR